jgi:hypothetical protein
MYFLRRRHGRKTPPEARREAPQAEPPARYEPAPDRFDPEPIAPLQPKVITKAKRQRIASPDEEDCKPAGTFRAGTLHLQRPAVSQSRHGKL